MKKIYEKLVPKMLADVTILKYLLGCIEGNHEFLDKVVIGNELGFSSTTLKRNGKTGNGILRNRSFKGRLTLIDKG